MSIEVILGPVIEAGESLSSGISMEGDKIVRITTPLTWDGSNISFQISSDGVGYNDLYDSAGNEIVISCGPDRAIVLEDRAWWVAIQNLKIRSGTAANPIPQHEACAFAVAIYSSQTGPKLPTGKRRGRPPKVKEPEDE